MRITWSCDFNILSNTLLVGLNCNGRTVEGENCKKYLCIHRVAGELKGESFLENLLLLSQWPCSDLHGIRADWRPWFAATESWIGAALASCVLGCCGARWSTAQTTDRLETEVSCTQKVQYVSCYEGSSRTSLGEGKSGELLIWVQVLRADLRRGWAATRR